ncbi:MULTISPECIES: hypothetical protein [unclassified Microcoleus]
MTAADCKVAAIFYSRVYVDIWRLIADISEPALRGMIDICAVGARLN